MSITQQTLSGIAETAGGARIPRHVAIIMDGNRRWATARMLPSAEGHRRGVEAARRVVRASSELGIGYLTLYTFSSENWSRPVDEVAGLMMLLRHFIRSDLAELHRQNVRIRIIGRRDRLEADIRALLDEAEARTMANTGLVLIVAFNYGARQEIVDAVRAAMREALAGRLDPDRLDIEQFGRFLATEGIPDPDLIIRTSGEQRLSNFLLWQAAYAEFVFTPVLWPDFDGEALAAAVAEFNARERRFGGRLNAGSP